MKHTTILTNDEYEYLINDLLKDRKEITNKLDFVKQNDGIKVVLAIEIADEIRELAADIVAAHFDENYEPTKIGWILEHFIDKFYTG